MYFNPAEAYRKTQEKLVHFLLDRTMGAVPRCEEEAYWKLAREQLKSSWLSDVGSGVSLYAAPVLEGLFPYPSGAETIVQLEREGVLDPRMRLFIKEEIVSGTYNLYKHQADSIRASGVDGKDIIVSSGTGSGKTECFLYSMINNMLRANVDFDDPGVRVLMIYPRNALVKDQLRRILDMVMDKNPKISVGMYIGETERDENSPMSNWETEMSNRFGEDTFTRLYRRTRREIRQMPPQILITNYSMLEWMMLRDTDQSVFAQSRGKLQAIVLDEAHLYTGALGNDINMLIRRTLERFAVKKADVRFYATSATIGDGRPETLRQVASTLFGVDASRIQAITGDRKWPTEDLPVGGDFSEEERSALKDLRSRLVSDHDEAGNKPRNFLALTAKEVELLSRCSPDVTDSSGVCFLPYKLHTFIDVPEMAYSDLDVNDGEGRPLGHLQHAPIFPRGVRGVEVYSVSPRSPDEYGVYFKAYLEEENHPPFSRRLVAFTADRNLRPLYFRRRMDGDVRGFDLIPSPTGGWTVSEDEANGSFVLANRPASGGSGWAGAATAEDWLLRDGRTAISTWDGDAVYGSASLMPLAFMPQDMRLTAYTEMLFPELPCAEIPDGCDAEDYLYERSWQGRQMLIFSDSRSKAASTAPTLQRTHQEEFVKNCIYRVIHDEDGACTMLEISAEIFDRFSNEFHLSQNLYGLDAADINDLKQHCLIPSLVYCSLAIASETRSLEDIGAVTYEGVAMPCPSGNDRGVLFERLMIPGENTPSDARKEDFWQREVVPAMVELFRRNRAVYFHPAYEQIIQERRGGRWANRMRMCHEALGTGLGYVWYDLRSGMFLTEEDFTDNIKWRKVKGFVSKYFRLVDNDDNRVLRESIFSYLRNCASSVGDDVADGDLARGRAFVKVGNWRSVRDDDDGVVDNALARRGRLGVALNPYAFRFSKAENGSEFEQQSYFYQHVTDLSEGAWGGLSVPEHSAQLNPESLEDIEADFKDHRLNVISCTPTLEVGIDIGALPAITMANLPPDKAGYLQRAGRAGRGLKATAMITTFLGDSVWDKLVKEDSMSFFRRENVFSVANVESPSAADLVKKHVYLFLLGSFFGEMYAQDRNAGGGERNLENPILAWDRAGTFLANMEHLRTHGECLERRLHLLEERGLQGGKRYQRIFREHENVEKYLARTNDCPRFRQMRAYFGAKAMDTAFVDSFARVVARTVWAVNVHEALETLVRGLMADLEGCSKSLNDKLDKISAAHQRLEEGEVRIENPHRQRRLENLLDVQFNALYGEYLISYLTHNRVVPAYGFPIDVLSLVSGENELQRQKLLAIREFTPGNRIPMGHTYVSVDALAPNYGAEEGSRYRQWYLLGRCPSCQEEMPPHEIAVGEVRCPYCEHEFRPLVRRRCIEPTGYQSLRDPVNAALSRKRMAYVSPEMYLELHAPARIGGAPAGVEMRVSASCCYCGSDNPKEMATLKCVNEGPNGNGFVVHGRMGRAVPDAPAQVWQGGVDLTDEEEREKRRVKRWQQKEVEDTDERNYIYNAPLLCWMQVPTFIVSVQDMAGGLLLGADADSRAMRTLVKMSILRQAAEELKLDSRVLSCQVQVVASRNICHFALYSVDGDADCYFSEIEHIVDTQLRESRENGFLRRALSRIHQNAKDSQGDLLSYSNAREYMQIRDDQFSSAYQWIQNNLYALTHRQLEVVNGLTLKNPVDPLMTVEKGTGSVLLMFPELTISDLEEGSVILDLLAKTSEACEINVVYEALNGGEETLTYMTQSRMWALSQAHRRLKFRPVSAALKEDFRTIYGSGAHFAVDGHWYFLRMPLVGEEREASLSRKSWMEFLSPTIRKSCWTTEGREDALAQFAGLDPLGEPVMPAANIDVKPVYTQSGRAYSDLPAAKILKNLGIDTGKVRVRSVHYEDRYFMTPRSWIFFSWILREFCFEPDASVHVVTMPLAEKNGHPVLNLFGHALDRFYLRPTNEKVLGYAITREDADEFRSYVADKLVIRPSNFVCSFEECSVNVAHGREMRIELVDETGRVDTISILFDSGMDMLRFNLVTSCRMFSDELKSLATYDQRYYIVRGGVA